VSTILVSGAIANKLGNGGATWTRLSWILGLRRLGFDVHFVEQIEPRSCVDAAGALVPFEESQNLAYFRRVTEQFGLGGAATLLLGDGERSWGRSRAELLDLADAAELLVNITGHLTLEPIMWRLRRKAYIDLDPGFTQLWHASGDPGARLQGHDFYFTVGENIGRPDCPIPVGDIAWRRTRQPVLLEDWPALPPSAPDRFTTVASWRGPYGPVQLGGVTYGLKVHQFRKVIELPERVEQTLEIALDIHPADQGDSELLRSHGWRIVDPRDVAADPGSFRRYVQGSGAEFSVAQGIYVETASGWFSDRTVRYLASGKPALVQDTGFSRNYPVGEGLLTFASLDDAVAGARQIGRDYERHCRAARALAEEHFDSDKVLTELADAVGVAP
jgi:hypothetical protein